MKRISILLLTLSTTAAIAQNTGSAKQANELFQAQNFERSLEEYLLLIQKSKQYLYHPVKYYERYYPSRMWRCPC